MVCSARLSRSPPKLDTSAKNAPGSWQHLWLHPFAWQLLPRTRTSSHHDSTRSFLGCHASETGTRPFPAVDAAWASCPKGWVSSCKPLLRAAHCKGHRLVCKVELRCQSGKANCLKPSSATAQAWKREWPQYCCESFAAYQPTRMPTLHQKRADTCTLLLWLAAWVCPLT